MRPVTCVVLVGAAACGGGDGKELRHERPGFTAKVPSDLNVGADRPDESGGASLSVANADMSEEVFFVWSPSGSPTDPVPQFERHKKHEDLTRVVSEGELAGGGRSIHIERGNRVFVHSVVSSDGFGIECTASWPIAKPARAALADACKTLQPGGSGGGTSPSGGGGTSSSGGGGASPSGGGGGARDVLGAQPSMPAPLAKLRFGMPLAEVRASLPEALGYEFRPAGWAGVERVNLMFGNGRLLHTVYIHLARGTGKSLASGAWGPGTDGGMSDVGPTTTWTGAGGITAELTEESTGDVLAIGFPVE
ncbi:MAG TPA: hypothetical protein VIG06_13770 [Kofleriaceae bacterium]|jgi:hypothetical protein